MVGLAKKHTQDIVGNAEVEGIAVSINQKLIKARSFESGPFFYFVAISSRSGIEVDLNRIGYEFERMPQQIGHVRR